MASSGLKEPDSSKVETSASQEQQSGSVLDALNLTNSILTILIIYVLYKLFGPKKRTEEKERFIIPDPLPKHDMTLEELRKYDGKGPDKRVCIAILGSVYDVTKGYKYYGPGGAYATFAGRDASRAFARFDVMAVKDEWDDITDLDQNELAQAMEWKEQFGEKYDYVGRLVRSKEEILERPDFEDDANLQNKNDNGKSSTSTDDDIEVINADEHLNEENSGAAPSKKVSFVDTNSDLKE